MIPYVLHIHGPRQSRKRVGWTDDVVDNEQLNKRKSKSRNKQPTAPHSSRTHTAHRQTDRHADSEDGTVERGRESAAAVVAPHSSNRLVCSPTAPCLMRHLSLSLVCVCLCVCVSLCVRVQNAASSTSSVASMRAARRTATATATVAVAVAVTGTERGAERGTATSGLTSTTAAAPTTSTLTATRRSPSRWTIND